MEIESFETVPKKSVSVWNKNALVWRGENKTKTLVLGENILVFLVETKTDAFENAGVIMAEA